MILLILTVHIIFFKMKVLLLFSIACVITSSIFRFFDPRNWVRSWRYLGERNPIRLHDWWIRAIHLRSRDLHGLFRSTLVHNVLRPLVSALPVSSPYLEWGVPETPWIAGDGQGGLHWWLQSWALHSIQNWVVSNSGVVERVWLFWLRWLAWLWCHCAIRFEWTKRV